MLICSNSYILIVDFSMFVLIPCLFWVVFFSIDLCYCSSYSNVWLEYISLLWAILYYVTITILYDNDYSIYTNYMCACVTDLDETSLMNKRSLPRHSDEARNSLQLNAWIYSKIEWMNCEWENIETTSFESIENDIN